MRRVSISLCVLAVLASIAACGPSRRRTSSAAEANVLTLSEGRALEIVEEVLSAEGIALGPAWTIQLGTQVRLEVDVRLATSSFGIEWVSPQDREDLGSAIEQPASGGRLRIQPGVGDDANVHLLVLEHSTYRYANERRAVQSGVPGPLEAEGRLRRDLRDFLAYVRGQGGL